MANGAPEFVEVGANRVRLLRDGATAFPAMLAAIAAAKSEVLLEMYWFASDQVGEKFRAALVERARAGVRVLVIFDSLGSLDSRATWWVPLLEAGARVCEFSPVSPFAQRFRLSHLLYRDHRKILIVDERIGFTGGINLVDAWAPPDAPDRAWRDDELELRGPAVQGLRTAFFDVWQQCGRVVPSGCRPTSVPPSDAIVRVLTNRVEPWPNAAIRRAYINRVRRATASVDIASAYFMPGPRFLRALRGAARRGVRVRLLVPERSDFLIVSLAMGSLFAHLIRAGVEVYVYTPRLFHSKTAIFDGRFTTLGSHNLDSLSSRFNLECNVLIDSREFAAQVERSFEDDLAHASRIRLETWLARPWYWRMLARQAALVRFLM